MGSSGGGGGGARGGGGGGVEIRVTIPEKLRRTIQNLKEIAGNHTDEEVYFVLRECSMDPNEAAQKLLYQDTFHEVKRKNKKKEGPKEFTESQWKPGVSMRGGRGGRTSYPPRYMNNDVGRKSIIPRKENGTIETREKGGTSGIIIAGLDADVVAGVSVSSDAIGHCNGPLPLPSSETKLEESPALGSSKPKETPPTAELTVASAVPFVGLEKPTVSLFSQVDSVEVPTLEPTSSALTIVATKHNADGHQQAPSDGPAQRAVHDMSGNRVHAKEWKPKAREIPVESDAVAKTLEAIIESEREETDLSGKITELQLAERQQCAVELHQDEHKKREAQFPERQHVLIPNDLQLLESQKYRLTFGSFDANFGNSVGSSNGSSSEKSFTEHDSVSSQEFEEAAAEPSPSVENVPLPGIQDVGCSDCTQSPVQVLQNDSSESQTGRSSSAPGFVDPDHQRETFLHSELPQYSLVQATPSYPTFGLMPQMFRNQYAPVEPSDSHSRDMTPSPNIMAAQQADIQNNYFPHLYRPVSDADGHFPFMKYGNISVLPAQAGQASQEGGNLLVMPASGSTPTPPPVQSASVVQNSLAAMTQQPVQVLRQPIGMHLAHYPPPNYIHYNQYISPFYIPPPTVHFLSNPAAAAAAAAGFPQQPPASNIYHSPGGGVAAPIKYPIPHYKPGNMNTNQAHIGIPGDYGNYGPNSALSSAKAGENDDINASQIKENNAYITGQQGEVSAMWIPASGRDIPASSLYGLPSQGQQLAFAAPQAGAFNGIYHHPMQTVPPAIAHPLLQQSQGVAGSVETAGPAPPPQPQQQHRGQMNWTNGY